MSFSAAVQHDGARPKPGTPEAAALAEDRKIILTHCTVKGIQMLSLISPPLLILASLRSRSFSLSKYFRNVSLTSLGGGAALGFGLGYGRLNGLTPAQVEDRRFRLDHNKGQRRVDDWSVIGGVLGAIITPTIFLRRAPLPILLASGISFGVAGGVLVHVAKNWQDGTATGVGAMVEEAKEAVEKESK